MWMSLLVSLIANIQHRTEFQDTEASQLYSGRTLHMSKSSPELSGTVSLAQQPINTEKCLLQWQDIILWCGVL